MPSASIIALRRHPLDTCLSCYEAGFTFGLDYAARQETLGAAYRMHADLMDDWAALPSTRIHTVLYEDLVTDPEPVMRAVVDHCGLPWHPACVHPARTGPGQDRFGGPGARSCHAAINWAMAVPHRKAGAVDRSHGR